MNLRFFLLVVLTTLGAYGLAAQMSGTYTVNNAGGANFTNLGAAFTALETQGVSGPVIIEVYDDGGTYITTNEYALGSANGSSTAAPVAGVSATNTITIRAATGENPVFSGSAAVSGFGTSYVGTIAVMNVSYVTFEGLRITGGTSFGIHLYSGTTTNGVNVRRCIIYNCGVGIYFYGNGGTVNQTLIENNFVYNCPVTGSYASFSQGAIGFRRPGTNVVVRHNTVVRNSGTTYGAYGWSGGTTYKLANFSYNIAVAQVSGAKCWSHDVVGCSPTVANYNCYYFTGGATFHSDTTNYPTFAAWQTAGFDTNGMNVDPSLVSTTVSSEDLHLQTSSPCVDQAIGSPVTDDIDGITRPVGPASDIGADEGLPPVPGIYPSANSVNLGSTPVGTAGSPVNYTISGYLTTASTTVTAPANVEVKLSTSGTWVSSFVIPNTGTWGPLTINARIAASAPVGPVSGNITHVSTGVTQKDVSVSGTVTPPTIYTSTLSLNLGSTPQGVAGTAVSYTVSGGGLTSATSITAPSGVEISFSQTTGFGTSLNIATTGTWGPTTIWARITSSAPVGPVSGNIVHSSSGAATVNVAASGTVTPPTLSTSTPTLNLGSTTQGTASTAVSYTVSGSGMQAATTITAPSGVEISFSQTTGFGTSLNIATLLNWGPTTIWARIAATAPVGPVSGNISHASTGAVTVNVAVSGTVNQQPALVVNPSSLNLGTTAQGTAGSTQSYTVNGTATIAATTITAPAGVELSFNQVTWNGTLNIASTGTWPNTTIYVRIAASASAGPISGNVTNATTGATTQNVAVSGTVTAPPTLLATPNSLNLGSTGQGVPGSEFSYTLDGSALVASTVITAPAGVEISQTSGSGYSGTTTITTTPSFSVTIYVRLTGATVGAVAGNITNVSGSASENVSITGNVTANVNLTITRNGPGSSTSVDNNEQGPGGNGLVILDFTASTGSQAFNLVDITFSESGTADGQADLNFLALYEDTGNGSFDGPGTDTLATAAAGVSFSAANGDYVATLSSSAIAASTSRRFFLVCKLAGTTSGGETIQAEITGVTATTGGGGITSGVPTSGANPALTITPASMDVTLNGPLAYTTVNADSQGPGGNGHVICDVTLTTHNDSWTVTSLTFTASGTADEQADISFLALYEDNGNGSFDGPGTDTLATAAAGVSFNAPNGTYTATLTGAAGALAINSSKTFFLVAKLAGTASSGENFRAAMTGMVESSPSGGSVNGMPTAASSALVIDVATLTVNAGPANPADTSVMSTGTAFNHTLGEIRLTASNADFTISGVVLTLGGTGDWVNNISSVSVYQDDGNGSYDGADTLLFSGAASAGSITCGFSANLTVLQATSEDLWVVIAVAATAGGSPSESFQAQVAAAADVQTVTAGNVAIGTNPPVSGMLHVVDYSVTGFTPVQDSFSGGSPITITGTGFALPVTVTIGGVTCPGTAVVNPAGTQITGLNVPAGSGSGLAITLDTNGLGPQTLTQTFSYTLSVGSGGGGGGGGGGGCAGEPNGNTATLLLAALALLATATTLRRRRA